MAFYTLENEMFRRIFEISDSGVRTVSMVDKRNGVEYISLPVREFMFSLDDRMYSSWISSAVRLVDGNAESADAAPRFLKADPLPDSLDLHFAVGDVTVCISYKLYPGICGYRKHLLLTNNGTKMVKVTKLAFDDTCAAPGNFADCDLFCGLNDAPQSLCFTCEGNEDIVRCHHQRSGAGWIMGSSAPGVMRYMMIYPVWHNAMNALNMSSAPFACYLEENDSFRSPDSIFTLYNEKTDQPPFTGSFCELIRRELPGFHQPEGVMYCTWFPFMKSIDSALITELIRHAADLNFRYFVLDDGWFAPGNREVDKKKFPNGLEEIARKTADAGMTFGLWLNIGTDYGISDPDENWFAKQYDGRNSRLGFDYNNAGNILCLGSDYREYVLKTLCELTVKYHVGYFKLDFSSIASPYGLLPYGCHAENHAHHRNWEDSFMAMYDGMNYIRNKMAERFPEVILDFSFEAFGTEKPNIAALELSTLHHVTNISCENPDVQSLSRARRSFYSWLALLPPERILNGLLAIQHGQCAEALLTSFAGAPLAAGDLRTLSDEERSRVQCFAAAFNQAAADGHLTVFESFILNDQVDGFMRVNEKGSGFAAFFNHSDMPFAPEVPAGCRLINVETGREDALVPAGDCAMFFRHVC